MPSSPTERCSTPIQDLSSTLTVSPSLSENVGGRCARSTTGLQKSNQLASCALCSVDLTGSPSHNLSVNFNDRSIAHPQDCLFDPSFTRTFSSSTAVVRGQIASTVGRKIHYLSSDLYLVRYMNPHSISLLCSLDKHMVKRLIASPGFDGLGPEFGNRLSHNPGAHRRTLPILNRHSSRFKAAFLSGFSGSNHTGICSVGTSITYSIYNSANQAPPHRNLHRSMDSDAVRTISAAAHSSWLFYLITILGLRPISVLKFNLGSFAKICFGLRLFRMGFRPYKCKSSRVITLKILLSCTVCFEVSWDYENSYVAV